ncbi:farnesol dehydrogenase [Drosophila teissieri]|uniref:farnesol dehydrogenase n=1 Tax=Drosophila teissieri TaxID=7243 RepID=UPI001CB9E3D5|nr:farnesol dehydrogenase [Drosophila teissieri]XP_043660129.1 farnesol dehydrogenase [Drosophila teissieri]
MERWHNCVAVVTGASSGIGAEIARKLVSAGVVVVALARRLDRLEQLRQELPEERRSRLRIMQCDVSDVSSVNAAFDAVQRDLGGVDILINNAGKLSGGQLLTMSVDTVQQVLQTNVMGVVYCTRRAFESMRQRQAAGHVVLLNSIVGHYIFNPLPGSQQELNMYPATKHAITALTELFRQEMREFKTQVKVSSISPGLVDTELVPPAYKRLPMLQAEDVANAILYVLSTPPHVQVHELTIKPMGEPF